MSSCDEVQRELSRFLDGSLPARERAAVRAHLSGCAACRGMHADLLRLRGVARTLGPVEPPDHVWLEIAGRIRLQEAPVAAPAPGPARPVMPAPPPRPRAALGQWIGLAAALLLVTLGAYWFQNRTPAPGDVVAPTVVDSATAELNLALEDYERAIRELETLAVSGESTIDPALAETIQGSLGAIDQAIAESRTALVTNPESEPARASLFDALSRKITTLQTTVSLINEMRQGDQEGAARVAAQGKKS
jgi:anti-sigma factor RsiW